jgi:hypothetical protein
MKKKGSPTSWIQLSLKFLTWQHCKYLFCTRNEFLLHDPFKTCKFPFLFIDSGMKINQSKPFYWVFFTPVLSLETFTGMVIIFFNTILHRRSKYKDSTVISPFWLNLRLAKIREQMFQSVVRAKFCTLT